MTAERTSPTEYTAFAGTRQIATGPRLLVLTAVKQHLDINDERVLIFEDETGRQVDFNFSGSLDDVLERERASFTKNRPGRPKLGVVGREVSLLPRHWEWLEEQPNGISAAIRRLVDEARKREPGAQRARRLRDAISRFMWAMAGDFPNFEETARALHAGDDSRVAELTRDWPPDVRGHVLRLASKAEELAKGS
jgi:hypothetical protein